MMEDIIQHYYQNISDISPGTAPKVLLDALDNVIQGLNQGSLRTCEYIDGQWTTHAWLKSAILLYFRSHANQRCGAEQAPYFDKIPLKFAGWTESDFKSAKLRCAPGAIMRSGSYIGPNSVLMPSFINIGAYIGEGSMIDTWATVGSCAQIGNHVHLSGGAGIGGVLEPLQATPTIVEDHCFIGARSEIVEGVILRKNAVIGMGVHISQSTRIIDRRSGEVRYGEVPEDAVVVNGSYPSNQGTHIQCAVIVKYADAKTRQKIGINALLRD